MILVLCTVMNCAVGCMSKGNGETNATDTDTETVGETDALTDSSVTLNGVPLVEYTTVYAWTNNIGEKAFAEKIQLKLMNVFHVKLDVTEDSSKTPQRAIIVGNLKGAAITNATASIGAGDWCLTSDSDRVYLLSKSEYGFQKALEALFAVINDASESKTILVSPSEKTNYADKRLTAMTFNIRNWDRSEGHLYRIKTVITTYTPDIIGFQEMSNKAGYKWVDKLLADSVIASTYGYIGDDRLDSTGEQCAIFYRKDKFTVVESGTRWLYCTHGVTCTSTDCKGEVASGRFSDDLQYNRIFTFARLKRIADGKEMVFISTHLDTSATEYMGVSLQKKRLITFSISREI